MKYKNNVNIIFIIICILFIIIGNTGIWFMPNIPTQYEISQNLTINPIQNSNDHYIMTNYFQPLLFNLFGGNTLNQYLIFAFLTAVAYIVLFVVWFINYCKININTDLYKIAIVIIFPVFMAPFYWIGMDGMTLLLMLLILINYQSNWSIAFSILLGMQHSTQGLAGFLLLFGTIVLYAIISKDEKSWYFVKNSIYIIVGIVIGKIILSVYFNIWEIELLENRYEYYKTHHQGMLDSWLTGWPYILYSLFGVGWLLIIRNARKIYPLLIAGLVAFFFTVVVYDETRVGVIILFPSLFYWVFSNKVLISTISKKFAISVLVLYLLLPVAYVLGGYPHGSLLKYDRELIAMARNNIYDIDYLYPYKENKGVFNSITFAASNLPGQTGAVEGQSRVAFKKIARSGYITFGPYIRLPKGKYKFNIIYSSSESNRTVVGKWDVAVALSKQTKKIREGNIKGTDNQESQISKSFDMPTEYKNQKVEIRNYYNGTGDLTIKNLTITRTQ